MSDFIQLYIERLGLMSVKVLLSESAISKKGRMDTIEEIACFKNEKPHLMTVRWTKNPKSGFSYKVQKSKAISEDDYRRLIRK